MDSFFKMVDVQTVLFIYMAVGFFCRKKGIFNDAARDKLTDFVVLITLPCMIFESFHMEFSLESLKQGGVAVLIATVMAAAALLLGKVLYNRFPYEEKSILQYGTLVTNSGFAGLPVVSGAYGDEGLFLGSLFIIPTRILMWSAGISLFTKADAKQAVRKVLLNPGIIAVEVGLVWMLFQLPLPHFVDTAVDNLGACTSPMAMALVGAILADVPLKTVFDPRCFYLVAVRQFLLPGICLAALRLLGMDPLTIGVSVVITGMPIGSTTAILAQKYGADAQFASKCVFISTLTSLVTVPILTLFLLWRKEPSLCSSPMMSSSSAAGWWAAPSPGSSPGTSCASPCWRRRATSAPRPAGATPVCSTPGSSIRPAPSRPSAPWRATRSSTK